MKDRQTYSIELDQTQYEFLQNMVEKYALPDVDKAVRCLVNYARDQTDKQQDIYQEIRCLDC